MVVPILTTKLYVPPVRSGLVARQRLIAKLTAGLGEDRRGFERRLTLISAPAGFGKTTLLSEWLGNLVPVPAPDSPTEEELYRVAWLSLDEGDNDPVRFLTYLIAVLQTVAPSLGQDVLDALQSPHLPPMRDLYTALINQLRDLSIKLILVLDDYHLIATPAVHDALTFFLDNLPEKVHLVLATRADPPLPIARFRARGQLTELRQVDLRFTLDEVAQFLNQAMGLGLSGDDVAALASRTEGWIAGLQMAALALQERGDKQDFVAAFAGDDRHVADYLVEEVLQRQPAHVQMFLLQTSVLERLHGSLCDAVLGAASSEASSQVILEDLERANLFVIPLDNRREWYRYHRLFSDLLRKRLYQSRPALLPVLHGRASEWYEQYDLIEPAIDHALAGGDHERAVKLIEQVAEATIMRSEVTTFLNWTADLPDELVRARPSLHLFHAWSLLLAGESFDIVQSHLQSVSEDADSLGGVAALQAYIAVFRGQMPRAGELSRRALEHLPEKDQFLRGMTTWIMSLSQLAEGDRGAATQSLHDLVKIGRESSNIMLSVMALCYLARLRMRRGRLDQAWSVYEQAVALATTGSSGQGRLLPIAGEALMGLGDLSREWNDLEAAERYTKEGIALSNQWSQMAAIDGYLSLARICQARGDEMGARESVRTALDLARQSDFTQVDDWAVALLQARLWICQGNLAAVERWAAERGVTDDVDPVRVEDEEYVTSHLRKYEHLVLARLWIAQDRPADTLALLTSLLELAKRRERVDLTIEVQILRALAFQAQGHLIEALAALEDALSIAEPGEYVRLFVDEGLPMARLLYRAAERGIAPTYVGRLLAASSSPEPAIVPQKIPEELIEPLTEREIEVLRLIAEGLTNQEIAQKLFLALPTIKWHTSNIYGKLGVHNRTQAVARAQNLGLL
jgi:LuxR family maltose regulon positive regulatory protein